MNKKYSLLIIFLCLQTGALQAQVDQDINNIFQGKLTLDSDLSNNTRAMMGIYGAMCSQQGSQCVSRVYRYSGSFSEAISQARIPHNADVRGDATLMSIGVQLGTFLAFTEGSEPRPMPDSWYKKAHEQSQHMKDRTIQSWGMTVGGGALDDPEESAVGMRTVRFINLSSPLLDMDNVEIVEGTWVTEIAVTLPAVMLQDDSEDFEEGWDESESDMDISFPPKARFVSVDNVSNSGMMQGDANYLVEISLDDVLAFYQAYEQRHCTLEKRTVMAGGERDLDMVLMTCLTHEGDVRVGDDVVNLTLLQAPLDVLSDALGRNQGTWTLIWANRWTEEEENY